MFRRDEVDEDGEIPAPFCYLRSEWDALGKQGRDQKSRATSGKGLQRSESDEFLK